MAHMLRHRVLIGLQEGASTHTVGGWDHLDKVLEELKFACRSTEIVVVVVVVNNGERQGKRERERDGEKKRIDRFDPCPMNGSFPWKAGVREREKRSPGSIF